MNAAAPNAISEELDEFSTLDVHVRNRPLYSVPSTTLRAYLWALERLAPFCRGTIAAIGTELALRDIEADEAAGPR